MYLPGSLPGSVFGSVFGGWVPTIRPDELPLVMKTVVPTTAVAMLSLALNRRADTWWQNVLIGLAGAAIAVPVTVLLIQVAMRQADQRRLAPKREPAVNCLVMERTLLVDMYAWVVGRAPGHAQPWIKSYPPHITLTAERVLCT